MRELIEHRGRDITLTFDGQVVCDAILREGRLPGGSVRHPEPDVTTREELPGAGSPRLARAEFEMKHGYAAV